MKTYNTGLNDEDIEELVEKPILRALVTLYHLPRCSDDVEKNRRYYYNIKKNAYPWFLERAVKYQTKDVLLKKELA